MDRRVEAAIELMKSEGQRSLSIAGVAQKVGLSPSHFTHVFKAATSKPPMKYLQEVRMQKAEVMLAKTALSLKEIIYDVGLNDRSHFSREFKKRHGLTPKEFVAQRRSYLQERPPANTHSANSATEQQ